MKKYNSDFLTGILFLTLTLYFSSAQAVNNNSLLLLESAEKISFVSQQIAKSYFYISQNVQTKQARRQLREGLKNLNNEIRVLSSNLISDQDEEEVDMLRFISYTRDELQEVVKQEYSQKNGALILDFSETLLEGSELLVNKHFSNNDINEASLVSVKKMIFMLERISKYYIAFKAGLNHSYNVTQLQKTVENFEAKLQVISAHSKSNARINMSVRQLNNFWSTARKYYSGIESSKSPRLVYTSTVYLGNILKKIENHHRRNLMAKVNKKATKGHTD